MMHGAFGVIFLILVVILALYLVYHKFRIAWDLHEAGDNVSAWAVVLDPTLTSGLLLGQQRLDTIRAKPSA